MIFKCILIVLLYGLPIIASKSSPVERDVKIKGGLQLKPIFSPLITLNNGRKMPAIGFGTYTLKLDAMLGAIEVGYRLLDTAFQYENERDVGMAVKNAIEVKGIKREELFITTKVWNQYHCRALAANQTKMSLKNLGLDYIDLLLMHYPTGYAYVESAPVTKQWFPRYPNGTTIPSSWEKDDYIDTWKGMEDMVKQGLVKSIGVSNFNTHQLDKLLETAEIKPVVNQIECNVYYKQQRLVDHCHSKGVLPYAYSPVHPDISNDPIIAKIAANHKKSTTQVALKWLIQRGLALVVKSSQRNRMIENINAFDFYLSDNEMKEISKLPNKAKKIDDPGAHTHPDYPFNEPME